MDTISNMLISIKNGQMVKKETVSFPYSKIKMEILNLLEKERFIKEVDRKGKKVGKTIDVELLYRENGQPAVRGVKRISLPSKRVYISAKEIKSPLKEGGLIILTTPKGLMSHIEAKKENLGGEVICEIW